MWAENCLVNLKSSCSDNTLESISLGADPSTFFVLYKDGSFAHSGGIPCLLYQRLLGRQEWLPRPELVRLGKRSTETFFLQYTVGHSRKVFLSYSIQDGGMDWYDLPAELEDIFVESKDVGVEELSLGEGDDYYVRLQDGRESWRLADSLAELLERRSPGPGGEVGSLALGWRGDYYIRLADGSCRSRVGGGVAASLARFLDPGNCSVELGQGGEYVVVGRRRELVEDRDKSKRVLERPGSGIPLKKRKDDSPGQQDDCEAEDGCCICRRPVGLVLCKSCGETREGRVRKACPSHPTAVYAMDRFHCPSCKQQDLAMMEEHPMARGAKSVPNKKILG